MSSTTNCVSFLLILFLISHVYSARILGVFTVPSISHQIVFQPIWKELSLRGHQVTVLSPNPLHDPSLTNLTEIDLSFTYKEMEKFKEIVSLGSDHWSMMNMIHLFSEMNKRVYENEEVQRVMRDNSTTYDVVLAEVIDPKTLTFAAQFNCPLIGVASLSVVTPAHESVGNPIHPILHPDMLTPYHGSDIGFFEKVDAVLFYLYEKYVYRYKYFPLVTELAKQYFGKKDLDDLENVERNISMLFLNTNPIIHGVRPYGPNVVEFGGGIHIKPPKPLPLKLKSFLDNATEGVIYFSLGSNVKSIYLPEEKRNILIRTFAKLPYKVLWKFEDDKLEGKPKNVEINKWLPQQDVLRHPNIKLFITQAGLQSTEEALSNGVPLLALPFMADQHFNAKSIEKLGVGLQLDFWTLSEESFRSAILEVVDNLQYKQEAVKIGKLIKDQPMTGLEKVIWWTEYVIRNKGAPYLKNPRAGVSWAEFLILDVVAFLLASLIAVLFIVYKISQYVIHLVFKNQRLRKKKLK